MQTTTRTIKYPLRETEPLIGSKPMPTTTTRLAGISRVHRYETTPGPFCLDDQHTAKTSPCRIRDGLSQTMIVYHSVHFNIFNRYQPVSVDNATRVLVREIVPAPAGALVNAGHNLPAFHTGWGALFLLGQKALRFSKCLLLSTKKARVCDLSPCRESGERLETNVYSHLLDGHGQSSRLPLARYGDVPLTCAAPSYTYRLRSTLKWAVQYYFDRPHFGQAQRSAAPTRLAPLPY
jgi:hypothetical protein